MIKRKRILLIPYLFIQVKDNKILSSLKLQGQAQLLKEEEEKLAKLNAKTEFSQRLLNPTAGSRNLMRCLQATSSPGGNGTASTSLATPPAPLKSITARDLLQQHKIQLSAMKANFQKSNALIQQPQLGRGLQQDAEIEIDLSQEVSFIIHFLKNNYDMIVIHGIRFYWFFYF